MSLFDLHQEWGVYGEKRKAAMREGWGLWSSFNSHRGLIQRVDEPATWSECEEMKDPVFASDEEARRYVAQRAAEGSALHAEAWHAYISELMTK